MNKGKRGEENFRAFPHFQICHYTTDCNQLTVVQTDRRRPTAYWLPVLHWSVQPGIPHQTALLMAARAEVSPSTVHYRPSSHLVARRQRHDQRVEPAGPSQRRALHTERHHRHHGNQVSSARRPARPGTHLDHQPRESQRSPGSNRANDAVSYSAHHHPRRGIVMFLVTSARMCVCMCV